MITYCVGCGTEMETTTRAVRIYCSRKCNHRIQRAGVLAIVRELQPCITCGGMFEPPKRGHKAHCSLRCRQDSENVLARARRAGTTVGPRPCTACGVEYLPNRRGAVQKYCTVECRTTFLLARDRNRRGKPTPVARDCLTCGKTFVPGCDMVRGAKVVVCSRNCHSRVDGTVKRARRHTDQVERIYPMIVMERDNWTCGICGDPISLDAPYPSSRYRSIDHVLPLTKGGAHLYSNVRAAHFGCNVARSNEISASYMTG